MGHGSLRHLTLWGLIKNDIQLEISMCILRTTIILHCCLLTCKPHTYAECTNTGVKLNHVSATMAGGKN